MIVCFVDIDEIADHHGLNLHFITISHIESLNIKKIIDQIYSCFVSYNMVNWKTFDTYRIVRLGKSLTVPTWIDVI